MNDETKPPEVAARPTIAPLPVVDTGEFAQLLDTDRFAQVQRVAKLFSESDLVPEVFQGKPANCAVALQMAFRMRVDPMMLMQNMYIVKGRPGIEAKLAIALMNSRGPFDGPLQWRLDGEGDSRSWTCFAIHRGTQKTCEATVTWAMVKAEGWDKPRGKGEFQQPSKWTTIPDIMGRYRSAMILGRLYCPEVLLGLPSDDELHDAEIVVGGSTVERAPRAAIPMPRPKAPAAPAPVIDVETGEVMAEQKATVAAATEAAQGTMAAMAPGDDPMSRPASEAQKRAILATGKRLTLSDEEINTVVQDATTFTVATLPMGAVNAALGALAKYKPDANV